MRVDQVARAALSHASPQDAASIAQTAHAQGRCQTAEHAYRQAWRARAASPGIGPTTATRWPPRTSIVRVLRDMGRLVDAEAGMSAVLGTMTQVLGRITPTP